MSNWDRYVVVYQLDGKEVAGALTADDGTILEVAPEDPVTREPHPDIRIRIPWVGVSNAWTLSEESKDTGELLKWTQHG